MKDSKISKNYWKDAYYHLILVPKNGLIKDYENNIDIYVKGKNLDLFIADVFKLYHIKILDVNLTGFIL